MRKIDYSKFIIPTKVSPADSYFTHDKEAFTNDKIYIASYNDFLKNKSLHMPNHLTDFAQVTSMAVSKYNYNAYIRDSAYANNFYIKSNSNVNESKYNLETVPSVSTNFFINPCLSLAIVDLNDLTKKRKPNFNTELIEELKSTLKEVKVSSDQSYYTVKCGKYIQDMASQEISNNLEKLYNNGNLDKSLIPSGQYYSINGNIQANIDKKFLTKLVPVFIYNGEEFARLKGLYNSGNPMWFKVQPIEFRILNWKDLPKVLNPRGKSKNNYLSLMSEHPLLTNINAHQESVSLNVNRYGNVWINSTQRSYLNGLDGKQKMLGENFYKTINSGDFTNTGGFINEAFNLSKTPIDEFTISPTENKINAYAFAGCVSLKRINVPYNVRMINYKAFEDINLKYAYRDKNLEYITFATELPKDIDSYEIIYLQTLENYDYNKILNSLGFLAKASTILHKRKLKFDFKTLLDIYTICNNNDDLNNQTELILNWLEKGEFSFFNNEAKKIIPSSTIYDKLFADTYLFAYALGAFSNQPVLDKFDNPTNVMLSQKVCSFLAKLHNSPMIESYFRGIYSMFIGRMAPNKLIEPNQQLFKFMANVGKGGKYDNIEILLDVTTDNDKLINIIYENFDEIKKLRNSIDSNGMPRRISWQEAIGKFYFIKYYSTKFKEATKLEKLYAMFGVNLEEAEKAQRLFDYAKKQNIPEHLLHKPLKETLFAETEALIDKANKEFEKSGEIIDSAIEKQFTYEFLSKHDEKNAIIGLFASCCATLHSGLYGSDIAKSTIISPNTQNIVVYNKKQEIVAKGTLYLDRKNSYGVINDFELNFKYKDYSKSTTIMLINQRLIFNTFIRALNDFVTEYDKQNPTNPLKMISVGDGFNRLKEECREYSRNMYNVKSILLPVPNEFNFEDASITQFLLYKNPNLTEENLYDEQPANID